MTNLTLDQVRDRIAELTGHYFSMDRELGPIGWCRNDGTLIGNCPTPETLDGIAGMMPSGYVVCIQQDEDIDFWIGAAKRRGTQWAHEAEGRDELTCRTRLILAVLTAKKEQP